MEFDLSNSTSELEEIEQFKKWSIAIFRGSHSVLYPLGLVKTKNKFKYLEMFLDKMFVHFQNYNQNVIEHSETEEDSLILIDAFRVFLENINPLFIDERVEATKGKVTISRVIYEYLNEIAETDPLEGYRNNPLKSFPHRYFI